MKSGLGDRNNEAYSQTAWRPAKPLVRAHLRKAVNKAQCCCLGLVVLPAGCLNRVRSWRPEQFANRDVLAAFIVDVSMKSGLGDRNNPAHAIAGPEALLAVSMKSGLGDRNNRRSPVRGSVAIDHVSMKSGLGDRNNRQIEKYLPLTCIGLNEVRSWRPEQLRGWELELNGLYDSLNEVRS